MNTLIKKFVCLGLLLFNFIFVNQVLAQQYTDPYGLNTTARTAFGSDITQKTDIYKFVGNIINVVLGLLGIIFLVLIIYAGVLWMLSPEEKNVTKAKDILKNASIGLAIVLLAYSISYFVISSLIKAVTTQ